MHGGETISIPVRLQPLRYGLGLDVTIRGSHTIFMVLDSGSTQSTISPGVARDLRASGLIRTAGAPGAHYLSALSAGRWSLPDLTVRELPRLTRLSIDGLLGLDFFDHFELTCFRRSTMSLMLERPAR